MVPIMAKNKTTDIRRLTDEEYNELAKNRDLRRLTDEEYERLAEKYPKMKKYVEVKHGKEDW